MALLGEDIGDDWQSIKRTPSTSLLFIPMLICESFIAYLRTKLLSDRKTAMIFFFTLVLIFYYH